MFFENNYGKSPIIHPKSQNENIPRNELIGIADEWGINSPTKKSDNKLQREIWEAQVIQKMYDSYGEKISTDLAIDSKREFPFKWKDGIELRRIGLDFESLITLIKNKVYYIHVIKAFTRKQMEEDLKLSPPVATLLAKKYSTIEQSTMLQSLERLNLQDKEKQLSLVQQRALTNVNNKRWPNKEKQSITDFIKTLEWDLRILDPSKGSWIERTTVLLENEARAFVEHLNSSSPFIQYDEWKEKLLNSTITQSEKTDAIFNILQKKYDTRFDPRDHFRKIETSVEIIFPEASSKTLALFILSSLPNYLQNEIIPEIIDLDIEEIKFKVFGHWQKNKAYNKLKRKKKFLKY